jgi:hypothetical protein
MVYAYAAYAIIGINVNAFAEKAEAIAEEKQKVADKEVPKRPVRRSFVPPTRKGFANSWR